MTGLLFPKIKSKKKRKKHPPSILHQKDGTCYLCIRLYENYSIYGIVHEHHEYSKTAVHDNYEYMRLIQQDCQREYEKNHTRQQFMELIGRNYLEE